MSEPTTPSTPERCFIKPVSEHPRQKSEKSEKIEKPVLPHIEHEHRSSRSNSVRSSSSKHSSIKEDIEHKLSETHKVEQPVEVQPEASVIQKYLDQESQIFSEYTSIDIARQFNYQEFLGWRHNAGKMNEHHHHLNPIDIVVIEKYVMDGLNQSEITVLDLNEKAYFEFRQNASPYFIYLEAYLQQSAMQTLDVSYFGYEYYAQLMRERAYEIEVFRQQVIESNQVSYSQEYFDEYVQQPDCKHTLTGYDAYYHVKEDQEKEEVKDYQKAVAGLKAEIKNLNLYVYDSFVQGCYEQGVEPTLEGYEEHLKDLKEEFADDYLQEKHEELQADVDDLDGSPQKSTKKIAMKLDDQQLEFLGEELAGSNLDEKQGDKPTELETEAQFSASKNCKCCNGKPFDCEGQACALIGECICQTNY